MAKPFNNDYGALLDAALAADVQPDQLLPLLPTDEEFAATARLYRGAEARAPTKPAEALFCASVDLGGRGGPATAAALRARLASLAEARGGVV